MNGKLFAHKGILKKEYVPSSKCDYITFRVNQFKAQEKRNRKDKGYESLKQKEERIDKMLEEIYFGAGSEKIDEATLDDRQCIIEYEGSNAESSFSGFILGFLSSTTVSFIFSIYNDNGNWDLLFRCILFAISFLLLVHILSRSTKVRSAKGMAKDVFLDKYSHETERKCLLKKREQLSTTSSAHEPSSSPQSCCEVSCQSSEDGCYPSPLSDCEKSDSSDKAGPGQNS